MARASTADYLQTFRFHLVDAGGDTLVPGDSVLDFQGADGGIAGFSAISGLDVTANTMEIREGNSPWPHTIIQNATVGVVTLSRGMVSRDSDFYNWANAAIYGWITVRRNLALEMRDRDGNTAKIWLLHGCIPVRCAVWPGLEATASDVAITELDIQPHYVEELSVSSA